MPHDVYIAKDSKLTKTKLVHFIRQYKDNNLRRIELIADLKIEWQKYAISGYRNGEPIQIQLPSGRGLTKSEIPDKPGVYAIFARKNPQSKIPICFYVGISTDGHATRGRIIQHLRGDIDQKYREQFQKLKEDYSEIYICYATISKPNIIRKMREKLELIEICLTASLKPLFLALVTAN
jgi:hypothetical protein